VCSLSSTLSTKPCLHERASTRQQRHAFILFVTATMPDLEAALESLVCSLVPQARSDTAIREELLALSQEILNRCDLVMHSDASSPSSCTFVKATLAAIMRRIWDTSRIS
jgi:hypothetical protein